MLGADYAWASRRWKAVKGIGRNSRYPGCRSKSKSRSKSKKETTIRQPWHLRLLQAALSKTKPLFDHERFDQKHFTGPIGRGREQE